jgi:Protein of unknown function (DUF3574)
VLIINILLAVPAGASAQVSATAQASGLSHKRAIVRRPIPVGGRHGSLRFVRTELFFGTARPDGAVTDEEFRMFLDIEVTPRFPDGLTLLKGDGQFTGEEGVLIKEQSFVLILLYPVEGRQESDRRIEEIRQLYEDQFDQESVLRVDDPLSVWVTF